MAMNDRQILACCINLLSKVLDLVQGIREASLRVVLSSLYGPFKAKMEGVGARRRTGSTSTNAQPPGQKWTTNTPSASRAVVQTLPFRLTLIVSPWAFFFFSFSSPHLQLDRQRERGLRSRAGQQFSARHCHHKGILREETSTV